jgi:hypothetical protein
LNRSSTQPFHIFHFFSQYPAGFFPAILQPDTAW